VPAAPPSPRPSGSRHRGRGIGLMVLSTVSFTANLLLITELGRFLAVNFWLLTSLRFLIGLTVLLILFRPQFQARNLFTRRGLALRGLVGAAGVCAQYLAVVHLGVGRTTLISSTYIFWAALMAAWVLKERLRAATVAGSVVAFAGLALLTDVFGGGVHPGVYVLCAVLSALGSAYVAVVIRHLHATEHTATIFGAQCVYGLLFCGPFAALHPQPLSALAWPLLILAGVCVAAGQLSETHAYRHLPVAEGTLLKMLAPVCTVAGGVVFFGEKLSTREIAGATLILASIAATVRRSPA
jgi:drug/metabolite transporter (DMT)-like permease